MKRFHQSRFTQKGATSVSLSFLILSHSTFTQLDPVFWKKQLFGVLFLYTCLLIFYLPSIGPSLYMYYTKPQTRHKFSSYIAALYLYPCFALFILYLTQLVCFLFTIESFTAIFQNQTVNFPHLLFPTLLSVYFLTSPKICDSIFKNIPEVKAHWQKICAYSFMVLFLVPPMSRLLFLYLSNYQI
ncbi:MAG: hypothetical protein KC646_08035 [Candidatus Cloacimonetes bacterium]|nr:hypothetical protein [Candidatus Cloacimonadota bacterium]